jgi:hypothetical protein
VEPLFDFAERFQIVRLLLRQLHAVLFDLLDGELMGLTRLRHQAFELLPLRPAPAA